MRVDSETLTGFASLTRYPNNTASTMGDRIETDSLGTVRVPEQALYGAQTQRAIDNFPVSGLRMPRAFILALGCIKACAASANAKLKLLDPAVSSAIRTAALAIAEGEHDDAFPVDVFQTGSGTSSNMNINEVIATLASRELNQPVHPNDQVNMGQSSNDVIPSAIHVSAAIQVSEQLLPALEQLQSAIEAKAFDLKDVVKTGRTHLMDGMPLTFAQELGGWAAQIGQSRQRLDDTLPRLCKLAQGGSAVGTGVNVHPDFPLTFAAELSALTGMAFEPNPNFFEALSCQDTSVELSGQLRVVAVALMKIANDLRWMNSGPLAGLAEIELQALQPGSSIMPGKVNPVIPESVAMVAAQVMGNDATIAIAGQSGNFQLNVMLPVIAYNLLQSIELLSNASRILADHAISTLVVQQQNIQKSLTRNPILVTALNPIVGYSKAAEIAKQAYAENRPVLDVAQELTNLSRQELEALLDPLGLV